MTFDTRKGTRGSRAPGGKLYAWANKMAIGRVKRKSDGPMLVLTTVGRKTGATRESALRWVAGADGGWIVVASANGSISNPAWYYNLAAQPDVTITVGGRTVPVTARQLHGDERADGWRRMVEAAPRFAGYAKKTDRELPVILLTERSA
ncbi:nitroreductase/quinone reductase family protein [Actinoplanes sp. CA-030573]|uniref:nitroreductase/quinone reductase family protein n=1 Tax=Actinoplanes sp. CA-030573 TaxID=3239898 RepID=UPI003D949769